MYSLSVNGINVELLLYNLLLLIFKSLKISILDNPS